MKKLILASASPQRRKLMKILGLPFIVRPSRAKESRAYDQRLRAFGQNQCLAQSP